MRPLDRRTVLRGAGVAVALPWLEAMRPARAATAPGNRKVIFWYTPNGQDTANFRPSGAGTAFQLGKLQAPLERLRADLILPAKLDNKAAMSNPRGTNGHNAGITSMLTSTTIAPDATLPTVNNELRGYATGTSIDWAIASRAPGASSLKMPLVVAGSQTRGYEFGKRDPYSYVSYKAGGVTGVNGAEENPWNLFKALFQDYQAGSADAIDRARARRKSILDFVATRYSPQTSALAARLGAADRKVLDAHLTSLRELESRLTVGGLATCAAPPLGAASDYRTPTLAVETKLGLAAAPAGDCSADVAGKFGDPKTNASFPDVMRAHTDLIVMAMTCGLTRVATLQHSGAQSGPSHTWACAPMNHHGITHQMSTPMVHDYEAKVSLWYATRFAALVDALKKAPDANGTLFDHTVVVWFSEMADAAGHTHNDLPLVLAGSCGGAFKTGRLLSYPGRSQADLWVNVMNAMGVPGGSFGDPRFCTGALPDLA
jgi:hypothetical protein